ncbi:MAG: LuxR C-terminal-related transcriptional regulator [Chloroflexota bacterium]
MKYQAYDYSSLLSTKLFVPPVRSTLVSRPRLLERLARGLSGPLTLISAPAGYGKTTLFSEWRAGPGASIPLAWLSLGVEDNDPPRFYQYLLACLNAIQPGTVQELLPLLQSPEPSPYQAILTPLVNALNENQQDFVLALDDYHVIETDAIHTALIFLLDHLPAHMHLAILSRVDPPLPLARLRVRNQVAEIREADLRFTPDEVSAFLNEAMGLSLSAEDIIALDVRTEGWIAGLQLAALALQGRQGIHGFVSAFTGSHRYVMDYLAEEVLKLQPKKVSAFLLQTSILDRLCGSLCEAVCDAETADPVQGQAMLEALEEKNLFVIPLDDERRWYRYHHLFADVLRKRLENRFPQMLPELHRRASRWYEQNGFISESIQQAILAEDHDRAAHLIEQNGCFLLISGEVATLLNWANVIEFHAENRPWLAIQKAWALALTGELDRSESILQVPEKLLAPLDPTAEVRTMQGTITAARAHCANSRGDTRSAAEYARLALAQLPDCNAISRSIRSVATSILGDASWINGNLEQAIHAYTEAMRIGREANNQHMVIIASANLADILMEQGQFHRAAYTYQQALQMAVRPDGQRSPLAGGIYASLGRISYECNRLKDAEQYFRQCIALCQKWGELEHQAVAYAMLARLEQVQGNLKEAQEATRIAEQFANEHSLSFRWSIRLMSDMARLWLSQGNLEMVSQLIRKSGLAIADKIPYPRAPEYVILLRILLAQNDYQTALALSKRLLRQADAAGRMGLIIEILILRGLAFQGNKDTDQAVAALEKALSLAQPERCVRIFLDEGEAMTRLLCQVRSRQVGSGYAAELLSKIGGTSGMTQPSMQLLVEPLTTRELEVLKLIEAGCSNQDISEQLVISITTVKRHISNLYAKLGVESRTQAIAIGKELKLFE